MSIFDNYTARYERTREEEYSMSEFLALCKKDPLTYASAPERMLAAIGEPPDGDADSLGILVNTWEVNRGAFRYLAERSDQTVKIMTLTEDKNRGWSDALANRWLLVKDGDNSNVSTPGLAVGLAGP